MEKIDEIALSQVNEDNRTQSARERDLKTFRTALSNRPDML